MKLALLGYPIGHSLSPKLYQEILGERLENYDLLACPRPEDVPLLSELSAKYDGLNITAPYKNHFNSELDIVSEIAREIDAVNTISFANKPYRATNTDAIAVEYLLARYIREFGSIYLIILGGGAMSRVTELLCQKHSLSYSLITRQTYPNMGSMDLNQFRNQGSRNIIINTCSRNFIFSGRLNKSDIFWDYNYSFEPHESTIPQQVMAYHDGQEMLRLQAMAAVEFWNKNKA